MRRCLAYSGEPIALAELIFNTEHSLIDQSLSAHSSEQTTNGDGFGIGWYDDLDAPGLYRHIQPAWNDSNLKDLLPAEYHPRVDDFSEDARAIVSDPLAGLPDLWCEIPESTFVTIEAGEATYRDFSPR